MKKVFLLAASFLMVANIAFSQKEAKLTVEISNDSILLGNYIEVKFTIENTSVKKFEAPDFTGFNIVSGPNQSSSMMINNGEITQSIAYSYYLEPMEVGNYFIEPAYVETEETVLESIPMEVLVVDNPDGIIQSIQPNQNKLFNQNDFFGGNDFFNRNDFFEDFFNRSGDPFNRELQPNQPKKKTKSKKKKKVYKL